MNRHSARMLLIHIQRQSEIALFITLALYNTMEEQ